MAKKVTRSKWPATILAKRRMVSVAGRKMNVERISIGVEMKYSGQGTTGGDSAFLVKPQAPEALTPAVLNAKNETIAGRSGAPMPEAPAILIPGMMPVRFIARIAKNMKVSTGT